MKDRIQNDFSHHSPPSEEAGHVLTRIRQELAATAEYVVDNTPPGREQSVALTKLEEAMFWANAAVARCWPLPEETDECDT